MSSNYSNGFVPRVEDIVRGKGLNRHGLVVGTVVGLVESDEGLKLRLAVARAVPKPVMGNMLKTITVYCENPLDPSCPVVGLETVMEYGKPEAFELLLRNGAVPEPTTVNLIKEAFQKEIAQKVFIKLGEFTTQPLERIEASSNISFDLGLTIPQIGELALALEVEFGFEISEASAKAWTTVASVIEFIQKEKGAA